MTPRVLPGTIVRHRRHAARESRTVRSADIRCHATGNQCALRQYPADTRAVVRASLPDGCGPEDSNCANKKIVDVLDVSPADGQIYSWRERLWPIFHELAIQANSAYCSALRIRSPITGDVFGFMQDELMFHMGAAYLDLEYRRVTQPDGTVPRTALWHLTLGLQMLRKRLSEQTTVDNATLLAILWLPFCLDSDERILVEAKIHWKAAATLIQKRLLQSGIEDSPGGSCINDMIEAWQPCARMWLSIELPRERPLEDKRFVLPPSIQAQTKLPQGFKRLSALKLIGPVSLALACNLVDLLGDRALEVHAADLSFSIQHTWRVPDVEAKDEGGLPTLELLIVQALQLYCTRFSGPIGVAGILPRSCRWHMTNMLFKCAARASRYEEEERAMFWIWLVTLDVWRTPAGLLSSTGKKLKQKYISRFADTVQWDEIPTIFEDYFSDAALSSCWTASPEAGQGRGPP